MLSKYARHEMVDIVISSVSVRGFMYGVLHICKLDKLTEAMKIPNVLCCSTLLIIVKVQEAWRN